MASVTFKIVLALDWGAIRHICDAFPCILIPTCGRIADIGDTCCCRTLVFFTIDGYVYNEFERLQLSLLGGKHLYPMRLVNGYVRNSVLTWH